MFRHGDWVQWSLGGRWNRRVDIGRVDSCYISGSGIPRLRIEVEPGAFYHYYESEVDFITVEPDYV